jgi:hypothetical protein
MRVLVLDLETRPIEARVWSLWGVNININQITDPGGVLCFAAKWADESHMHFASQWDDGQGAMVRKAHRLLSEADAVVGWNSDKFDLRWLNRCFVEQKLSPPPPFVKVDLMKSVRRQVMLPSYKLDFVARWLGVGAKQRTGGFDLWSDVLSGDPKARAKMGRYNRHDVRITAAVFSVLSGKGWVKGLPNRAVVEGGHICPSCDPETATKGLQRRGFQITKTRRYARWQCRDCGAWSQSTVCEPGSAKLKAA